MPKTKSKPNANPDPAGSQRKKNTNQRSNVTSQHNNTNSNTPATTQGSQPQNKKSKQNQNQTHSQTQSQNQSQASTKPSSPAPPPPKTATPPPAKVVKHVPLDGFNAAEVDELLSSGCDANALVYKPEQPVQKTSPWGQKRELTFTQDIAMDRLTYTSWYDGNRKRLLERIAKTSCAPAERREH